MSKTVRFDPLRLLSEIQSDQTTSSTSARSSEDETFEADDDDGFMSDKFLLTTEAKQPLTYTDKRRKLEAHYSRKVPPKSHKQREEQARQEGLDRDLLAEAEIIAGGGTLPPQGKNGETRWDLMETSLNAGQSFSEACNGGPGTSRSMGEDGTTKAMRMMLAMGYRRGEALGKRDQGSSFQTDQNGQDHVEEEEDEESETKDLTKNAGAAETGHFSPPVDSDTESLDTDEGKEEEEDRNDSQAREEDEYLTGGVSSAPFAAQLASSVDSRESKATSRQTEPLRPDQRWLGLNRRAGIGMVPKMSAEVSEAIRVKTSSNKAALEQQQSKTELDFRTRVSRAHQERHDQNILSRARKTLIELDRSSEIQYSPLWLDSNLYHLLFGYIAASSFDATTIDERIQKDAAFKEAVELLQFAFSSHDTVQVQEATTFCNLDTKAQLDLVLSRLRKHHCYCLFCGCQYASKDELDILCPGEAEDDHD